MTGESCGDCTEAGQFACNDGVCAATCDDTACAAMGFTSNTCVSSGECDGTPDGFVSTFSFSCSADKTTCDMAASGVGCGIAITECMPCDLAGTDDGRCANEVCVAPDAVVCE